jgi:hypothetical protein
VLLPTLTLRRRAWYLRHREAVITLVRLGAAAAAPLWLLRDASAATGARISLRVAVARR